MKGNYEAVISMGKDEPGFAPRAFRCARLPRGSAWWERGGRAACRSRDASRLSPPAPASSALTASVERWDGRPERLPDGGRWEPSEHPGREEEGKREDPSSRVKMGKRRGFFVRQRPTDPLRWVPQPARRVAQQRGALPLGFLPALSRGAVSPSAVTCPPWCSL